MYDHVPFLFLSKGNSSVTSPQFNVFPYLLFRPENFCLAVTLPQGQPEIVSSASVLLNLTSLKFLFIGCFVLLLIFSKNIIKYHHGEEVFDVLSILNSKLGLHLALGKPVKTPSSVKKQGRRKTSKITVCSAGCVQWSHWGWPRAYSWWWTVVSPMCIWGKGVFCV